MTVNKYLVISSSLISIRVCVVVEHKNCCNFQPKLLLLLMLTAALVVYTLCLKKHP